MTTLTQTNNPYLSRPSYSRGLADIIDSILDKGLVIDAYVRISAVGIELLTIDARIVIASVDTYLRWAEAVNRLDLAKEEKDLPELIGELQEGGAKKETKGVLEGAGDKLHDFKEKETEAAREKTGRRRRQSEE
ncbi:MAG TPA: gas vesicle protein GvpJ [Streptosporangiaceae bacterium]